MLLTINPKYLKTINIPRLRTIEEKRRSFLWLISLLFLILSPISQLTTELNNRTNMKEGSPQA
jgi:uncharacterized membrane protein (DUF485 family)